MDSPSTRDSKGNTLPATWYLRTFVKKSLLARTSSAVTFSAAKSFSNAALVGAKTVTFWDMSSKALARSAAWRAATRVEKSGTADAVSTRVAGELASMLASTPWLYSPAEVSAALSAEAGATATSSPAGISSAVALPTAGIDKAGISSAVAFGAASNCRRLLLPPPLRALMADWGSITASMTCTMPWQVYTSLCAMVALPLAATMVVPS